MRAAARYDRIGVGYDTTRRADPYLTGCLVHHLAPVEHGRYLDVACGSGNYSTALAARGLNVTGVDQSERMIAAASAKSSAVCWCRGHVEAMRFGHACCDRAILTVALQHCSTMRRAFTE